MSVKKSEQPTATPIPDKFKSEPLKGSLSDNPALKAFQQKLKVSTPICKTCGVELRRGEGTTFCYGCKPA